jgi:hydrogenase maturation protease
MSRPRILVAGIGNIFLGDDAFGVEVVQRLLRRPLPEGVRVMDYGIRGFDLAYAMLEHPELVVLVDATSQGGAPGTLYLIEADTGPPPEGQAPEIQAHSMTPAAVFHLIRSMGQEPPRRVLVVGCEPETFGPEELGQMGLSDSVAAAVPGAVELVEQVLAEALAPAADAGAPPAVPVEGR